uniref:Uncharacterized protein n=1 Tax=Scleropages formosus TaxID=113540 RepID=A0A8C9UAB4_SCLFO
MKALSLHFQTQNKSFSSGLRSKSKDDTQTTRLNSLDWAVQGKLNILRQHHSSKASIFFLSIIFTVQLSHPYDVTEKTMSCKKESTPSLNSMVLCIGT